MMRDKAAVSRIDRIALIVADAAEAERFFAEAFAFETVERGEADESFAILLGLPGTRVKETIMRLGAQRIGLLAFDPPGRPYPVDSTSTDLWFQHFAIIVSDMAAAYERLCAVGRFTPISESGPQQLPPRSGSVSAFKFRDSEGHPLELLAFPKDGGPDSWRRKAGSGVCLGIDHSAIAVGDTGASVAFFETCLGLRLTEQTDNYGAEQSALDAVPEARVTVTGMSPLEAPPHVELLGYDVGARRPIPDDMRCDDRTASLFIMETQALAPMVEALTAAKARFISPGIVALGSGTQAIAILDPDGHRFIIMQRADAAAT